ncbi:MAG: hypothetical protein ACTHMV_13475 [Chitinophagaceae bacterium]
MQLSETTEKLMKDNDGRVDDVLEKLWDIAYSNIPKSEKVKAVQDYNELAKARNEEVGFKRHVLI